MGGPFFTRFSLIHSKINTDTEMYCHRIGKWYMALCTAWQALAHQGKDYYERASQE